MTNQVPNEQPQADVSLPDEVVALIHGAASSPMGAIKNFRVAEANEPWMKLLGYDSMDGVRGRPITDSMSPESVVLVGQRLASRTHGEAPAANAAYEFVHRSGSIVRLELTPLVWPSDPSIVLVIGRDVTEREQSLQALKESERLYRTLAEAIPCAMMLADNNRANIYVNDYCCELTGYSREELLDGAWLLHPDETCTLDLHHRSFEDGLPGRGHETRFVRKDGTVLWVSASWAPVIDASGTQQGVCSTFIDVTEQKRAGERLWESEEAFRSLVNALQEPAFLIDTAGNILVANQALADRLGYPVESITGKYAYDLLPPLLARRRREQIDLVFQTGKPVRFEDERAGRYYSNFICPAFDPSGKVSRVAVFAHDITERTLAERALRDSEERLRALVNNVPGAVFRCLCDDDLTTQYCSDAIEEISGYPASDFVGNRVRSYVSIIHPDDRKRLTKCVLEAAARREPYAVEYRIRHADGSERWVHEKGQGTHSATSQLTWIDGVVVDITAQRRSQEALRESEERYRLLAENATDLLWQMDMSGRFTFVSPAIGLFGYEVSDWVGHHMLEFLPPHEQTVFLERFAGNSKDPRPRRYEVQMLRKDGSLVWMEVSLDYAFDQGLPVRVQGIARDMTERKTAENALRESEERYRSIVESSYDTIMLTDPDGTIAYLSPSAATVIGHPPEELMGTKRMIMHPDDLEAASVALAGALRGSKGAGLEYRVITTAGETRWLSHAWAPVMDGDRLKTVVSVVRDITARRQVEEARKKALEDLEKAYDLQRQFLSSVTHEVRTPLTAVRGYAEMLLEGMAGPLNSEQEDLLRRVLAGSHHLLDLVDEVLEIARLRSGAVALRPRACKPCVLVERLVSTIAHQAEKKGVEISLSRDSHERMGMYDEQKLAIILTNILSNALKFTEAGRIDVTVDCARDGAEIIVADTGPGIRRHDLPTIFDEFVQYDYPGKHKPTGFGLGLAIVASMVDVIGATLVVSSRRGAGTAFTLYVPTMEDGDGCRVSGVG